MKQVVWNESARSYVRSLRTELRREIGVMIMTLQSGHFLGEPQSKPMKIIHKNAYELRLRDRSNQYRVIYILVTGNQILIPHAFEKKTQKTATRDIKLSISRIKEMFDENQ